MLLAPVVWILTIAICVGFAGKFWWFPPPISAHGEAYDGQFTTTLIVTGIIFFLAQMALGYTIMRFRASGKRVSIRTATISWKFSGPARRRFCLLAWC